MASFSLLWITLEPSLDSALGSVSLSNNFQDLSFHFDVCLDPFLSLCRHLPLRVVISGDLNPSPKAGLPSQVSWTSWGTWTSTPVHLPGSGSHRTLRLVTCKERQHPVRTVSLVCCLSQTSIHFELMRGTCWEAQPSHVATYHLGQVSVVGRAS